MAVGSRGTGDSVDASEKRDLPPVDEWIKKIDFNTTAEIKVPERLLDQVVGQDNAVSVVKKAAEQKRHLLLIGEPGTGKSMLAQSMTEFLPKEDLEDILVYHNAEDMNAPRVKVVPSGKGKEIVARHKQEAMQKRQSKTSFVLIFAIIIIIISIIFAIKQDPITNRITIDITPVLLGILLAFIMMFLVAYTSKKQENVLIPKLLVSHDDKETPPFVDGTGAHAGALLGDIRHDPFQSGGLETPAHERVEPGAIHRAHRGVLFVDEINLLQIQSQQALLTAMQEKRFPITGQSERSSGAMVRTEPVPCDFVLVASGNLDALQGMHPALRSRIKGSGYEIYVESTMKDTDANRRRLVRFVAQEIKKDRKIPHFTRGAVAEVIREAQRRAGSRGKLTVRLRELGGLVRVAGDIAHEEGSPFVLAKHVLAAKKIARSLERQVAERALSKRKEYHTLVTDGALVGVVNGLGVVQSPDVSLGEMSGMVLPIAAEVTPPISREEGKIIATGRLGEIAREAVQNVSALVKKYTGEDISRYDVHIQFLGVGEGVEGDSASVSVATAVISALEGIPVKQDTAMTGSLSVRGDVLPVGGVTAKTEAAVEAGLKRILIPRANMKDVMLESRFTNMIAVIPVETLSDVLENALVGTRKKGLLEKLRTLMPKKDVIGIEKPAPS